ncbi:MAG: hypothetical protein KDK64_02085 [Chlamydiia bacterium]|nr:hypothetical protein [Chlamydiia bacterium]
MERLEGSRLGAIGQFLYSYIDSCLQRIDEYATVVFQTITARFEERVLLVDNEKKEGSKEVNEARLKYERQLWDEGMLSNISFPQMNFSLSPSVNVIQCERKEPEFYVKLPRGQITHFPRVMQERLLNVEEDRLDIFFAIYTLEEGKKELKLSVPEWAKEDYRVHVGFYGGDGVRRGSGKTVPWHFIREFPKEEAKDLTVRVTDDVGAFMMGAYRTDCQGPFRGVAVYGLVLGEEGRGKVIRDLLKAQMPLGEFIQNVGSEVTEIFTFNDQYRIS